MVRPLRSSPGPRATCKGRTARGPQLREAVVERVKPLRTPPASGLLSGSGGRPLVRRSPGASDAHALLVVFQAMDAAGKDSTIKHVMTGVNPQGVRVVSFKQPSGEELDHTFLWRTAKAVPERGQIGIFNRSHYEEVVALRVHPDWLARQKLPDGERRPGFWQERYDDINAFERHLARNGTKIVKFFLNVSRAEQKRRFLRRLDNPDKLWKFSASDLDDRALWDDYLRAYDDAITATSTPWAPWYVLPADDKKVMQALAAAVIVDAVQSLDLRWPTVSDEDRRRERAGPQGTRRGGVTPRSAVAVAVPGLAVLRTYRREWLGSDLVAGLVVTTLLVPQGMAYAELAGLPPITGLYTTVLALLAYAVFGPSRVLVLGPDSSLGPMIAATLLPLVVADGDPERAVAYASVLALMVGAITALAGRVPARVRGRPALPADSDRLHERAGPHHPGGAAAQAVRLLGGRRHPAGRDGRLRGTPRGRRDARAGPRGGDREPRRDPGMSAARATGAGRAGRRRPRDRCR